MKAALLALAAAGSALASMHARHEAFHHKRNPLLNRAADNATCGCTTYTTTFYGAPTLVNNPTTAANVSTVVVQPVPVTSSVYTPLLPTPIVTVCPTPGTYTIPASTVTVKNSTVVPGASTATLTPGTQTYGGVTTVVTTSTVVTCPYATVSTSGNVTTSTIKLTTYTCPAAGTYTIAPTTAAVNTTTVTVYPVPSTFKPGTYTAPQTTITVDVSSTVYVCPFSSVTPTPSAIPTPSVNSTVVAPLKTSSSSSSSVYVAPSSSSSSSSAKPSSSSSSSSAAPSSSSSSSASSVYVAPSSSYVAPSNSYVAPSSNSAAPSSSAPASSKVYQAAVSSPASSAPASSAAASSSYQAPSSSAAKSSSAPSASASSSSGSIQTNGNQWAITYTPYSNSGACKSKSDVASDIASIKQMGFTTVRLYATDCSALDNIGSACSANGIRMILGVFIDSKGLSAAQEQVSAITSWKQFNLVDMIVIGNEAVFNGYCSASDLVGFVSSAKSSFQSAGYNGPCTTTEPLNIIQANPSICDAMDVGASNIHPFFNAAVSASGAGDFVVSQIQALQTACPGKKAYYNLETGWPSQGNANGAAVPGVSQQKTAIQSIAEKAGKQCVFFSFQNDMWKAPGSLDVEQFWGCGSLF